MENIRSHIEVLRIRNFLEHNHKGITNISAEFTIKCNKQNAGGVDNIFLTINNFLPNLKIIDSEGMEYPVMTNSQVKLLLELMKKKNKNSDIIDKLIKNIKDHKVFLIWIKIPPNKKLQENEVRIIHANFEMPKTTFRLRNSIYIDVSSKLTMPIFWIFKKPKDYDITNQFCYKVTDHKLHEKKPWKKLDKIAFYYEDTHDSSSLIVKPNQKNMVISYSFKPKPSIIVLPIASIVLLSSFAIFLNIIQFFAKSQDYSDLPELFVELLDNKIELSLFIITFSLIIPRLIANIEIRHVYVWAYFLPIALTISFFFGYILI